MAADRLWSALRSTASALTTPLLPDDYTQLLNPLWSARELRGRVERVIPETDEAATLVIRPGWGWSFEHQAGQFVGIGVDVGGKWHWRSYSLTSPPRSEDDLITITVKAMPEGLLSEHLVRGLEPGTVIRLAQPSGDFVLPEPPPAKLLFWTGGSGITPVMAMLRTLDRRGTLTDVVHIHSAPSAQAFLFADELETLTAKYDEDGAAGYRLHANLDDRDGIFSLDRLADVCPDWRDRQAWVCGPPPMLQAAEKHWEQAGLAEELHVERFQPAGFAGSETGEGGHVVFASSQKEVDADGATTLLEQGENLGIDMPFGCRMGICHTCAVRLIDGAVVDLRNGEQHFQPGQLVQTCVSAVAGNCTLDI
jgi:ferredoxin-NADP reductase